MITGSLLLAIALNFLFVLSLNLHGSLNATRTEEVFLGNHNDGYFACDNMHGDLYYCSAIDFFITHTIGTTLIIMFWTAGLSVLIPFILILFIWRNLESLKKLLNYRIG